MNIPNLAWPFTGEHAVEGKTVKHFMIQACEASEDGAFRISIAFTDGSAIRIDSLGRFEVATQESAMEGSLYQESP